VVFLTSLKASHQYLLGFMWSFSESCSFLGDLILLPGSLILNCAQGLKPDNDHQGVR
jgi:hypothetical protein